MTMEERRRAHKRFMAMAEYLSPYEAAELCSISVTARDRLKVGGLPGPQIVPRINEAWAKFIKDQMGILKDAALQELADIGQEMEQQQ